jgi:hypothetical protein
MAFPLEGLPWNGSHGGVAWSGVSWTPNKNYIQTLGNAFILRILCKYYSDNIYHCVDIKLH